MNLNMITGHAYENTIKADPGKINAIFPSEKHFNTMIGTVTMWITF